MFVFGCMGPLVRAIQLPSTVIACLRAWVSAIALILYLLISRHEFDRSAAKRAIVPMIFSGILIATDWIGLFTAYNYTTIAISTVFYYVSPVLVFLASPMLLGEKFRLRHLVCAIVSFVGMALVAGIAENGLPALSEMRGILFALLGAVSYAAVILINKKCPEGDPIVRTAIQLTVTALFTTPYILMTSDLSSLQIRMQDILLLLVLGVLLTAATYIAYFYLILYIPARSVAIFSYADPVTAVFISAVFLSEPLSLTGILGSILIIGAAIVSEF